MAGIRMASTPILQRTGAIKAGSPDELYRVTTRELKLLPFYKGVKGTLSSLRYYHFTLFSDSKRVLAERIVWPRARGRDVSGTHELHSETVGADRRILSAERRKVTQQGIVRLV